MIWTCLQDITCVYAVTGQSYYPQAYYACPNFDTAYLRRSYTPGNCVFLWKNEAGKEIICDYNEQTFQTLHSNWLKAIREHPMVYMRLRVDDILYFLRIKNSHSFFVCMYPWVDQNPYGFAHKETALSHLIINGITGQVAMPYMRPWLWLILNIVLLFLFRFVRNTVYRLYYIVLVSSDFLYIIPLLIFMNGDTDFRYFYWNCIACTMAVCLLAYDRFEQRKLV